MDCDAHNRLAIVETPMPHLALSCFGPFQPALDGEPLIRFHSAKAQCLLAYLVLEAGDLGPRAHSREKLATLLWPVDHETSARNSFRQTLYELRKLLGDRDDLATPFLLVTRQTVQFNQASDHTLDVADFLSSIRHDKLEQAATLYRGELLEGLSCESEPFEEWLRQSRARFHNLAIDVCFKLTDRALQQGDFAAARTYAQRQLALEPWREEAHRQLMTALALSGERSAALAQYETCHRILVAELAVEPDSETTALFEQIKAGKLRGQRTDPRPTSPRVGREPFAGPPPTVRHNLPPQPTPFIGRKNDLAQITARLADPDCRLLTIVGPGGMGKTRLAIRAAHAIVVVKSASPATPRANLQPASGNLPLFPDGIFFVALAGVASTDLLISTIATALDFSFYGNADAKTQLQEYLKVRTFLLVLDNFEHLLDGANWVSELLAIAAGVKVLATSREALKLQEEWLHPLTGMSFPDAESSADMLGSTVFASFTAVQLFAQRARQFRPDFDLASEGHAVAQICRLVEGMPLAIELAATWLKVFTSAQIVQKVEHSLDFLATSLRNVPARHRSMRAVFEHSWGLLAREEKQTLRRLAVFHGGFELAAAEEIASASFVTLLDLTEKYLLQLTPNDRFQMHELLRQFAEEKLRNDPFEFEWVQDKHCHSYCAWLDQQEARLKGSALAHLSAMHAIERDIENVRAAWDWAVEKDHLDELEQAIESLSYFHNPRAWYEQGMELFRRTAETLAGRQTDDRHRMLYARILTKQVQLQNLAALELGQLHLQERAKTLVDQALAILSSYGETHALAEAIWEANLYSSFEDYAEWERLCLSAITIFEKQGDDWRVAWCLENLGYLANRYGRHTQAIQYYQRAISLCEKVGDRRMMGEILNVYGEARRAVGEYVEATQLAEAALAARSEVGNKRGIAYSLYLLGDLAWRMGNFADALRYSQESAALFSEIGLVHGLDFALNNLGNIACTSGNLDEARRQFAQILQPKIVSNSLLEDDFVPWALVGMAEVLHQEGQPEKAIELIEQVLRHPNAWQEAKDRAAKLFAELQVILPPEMIVAAQARGQSQPLAATVAALLVEPQA
jgi:predicted ATPase/DNA-binding SARP family transcriptional activator